MTTIEIVLSVSVGLLAIWNLVNAIAIYGARKKNQELSDRINSNNNNLRLRR